MIITRHQNNTFTINASEKDLLLLRICVKAHIALAEKEGNVKAGPSYKDAKNLDIGLDHALRKPKSKNDAQN